MTEERVVIYANSNVSRGKFAAAAVHAALIAAGVHPGLPVIVLGAKPSEIEGHRTVIRDAGRTEVEPGTITAGTDWAPTQPTEDVRGLIEEARARLTTSRLGKTVFRETDKDLVVIKRLVDALEADREPGTVTDEMVEAAARTMFEGLVPPPPDPYTWAQMVHEDRERAELWREDARVVLQAAEEARR